MTDRPPVTLRPATPEDSADLLAWRNDPLTRANSRNTDAVTEDGHAAWLARVLADPNRRLWVALVETETVGTAAAARDAGGAVEISLTVAPAARGRGIAARLVDAAVTAAREAWPGAPIRAEIKPDNRASRTAFEACGFVRVGDRGDLLDYALSS